MKAELDKVVEMIKKEQTELKRKRRYMKEHKFEKEADFIQTKVEVIDEILYGLDSVLKGEEITAVRFSF
jgi:hypothetical protein